MEFTPKTIVVAITREFGIREEDLVVENFNEKSFSVEVRDCDEGEFSAIVYKDRTALNAVDVGLIGDYIRVNRIGNKVDLTDHAVVEAIADLDSCCLDDLKPWITATCREKVYDKLMTLEEETEYNVANDLLAILHALTEDDEAYHVLVAQCRPDPGQLAEAIFRGVGGSEGFMEKWFLDTEEGFVVDSDNNYTEDLVGKLVVGKNSADKTT